MPYRLAYVNLQKASSIKLNEENSDRAAVFEYGFRFFLSGIGWLHCLSSSFVTAWEARSLNRYERDLQTFNISCLFEYLTQSRSC